VPDTPVVIGRSHEVDITLVDDGISRKHATIEKDGDVWRIRDLGSTNGLFINGNRVDTQNLADGDHIRVGSTTILKYSLQDSVEEDFQRRMYDSAVRDGLTEVFNKRYFRDCLASEFSYYLRHDRQLSVLMLDIDHFKKCNDTYGHIAGDYILKNVAKVIAKDLRTEDILCRYGGEEFAVIMRSTGAGEALVAAERIRHAVAAHAFSYEGKEIKITVSIGVATLQQGNYPTAQHLVRAADKYLYAAKEAGRNRTACAPLPKSRNLAERGTAQTVDDTVSEEEGDDDGDDGV
jgi:diguanylate cyclase (GGDEF)-like protein